MASKVAMSSRGNKRPDLPHPNSAAESTWNLFNTKRYCDVKFLVGPTKTEILAHKLLLMARSSVFATMFADRWTFDGYGDSDSMTVVPLSDADPDIFRLFLQYIYTDRFAPDISKACSLYELADKYDIAPLVKKCDEFISNNFSEEESFEVFQWARRYSLNKLMDKAGGVMAGTFEKLLDNNDMLKAVDRETLIYLLKRDDLDVDEIQIFEITANWARIQASSLKQEAKDILKGIMPLIRFPLMDVLDFSRTVVPTGLLPKDDVITLFTYFNADGILRNSIKKNIPYSSDVRAFKASVKISLYTPYKGHPFTNQAPRNNALATATSVAVGGLIESLRFKCNLTGITKIQSTALLSGFTLAIPDYLSTSGFHVSSPSEYFVHVFIKSLLNPYNPTHVYATFKSCGQRVKLQLGSERIVQLQQNIELKQGYTYSVHVGFGDMVMLKNQRSPASDLNFDELNDSVIPNIITHPSENGTIQLANLRFSTNRQSYHGYHVVRKLHFQLDNSKFDMMADPYKEKNYRL